MINSILRPVRKRLCIYHANCSDGFGAAYAVWRRFGNQCEFHAASYGEAPPDVTGKHVYLVDFCYPMDVLKEMARKCKQVVVLDHHKSALMDWSGRRDLAMVKNLDFYFDMARSGAVMAWEYFHDDPPPQLLLHVQDRDLWRFELPHTREVMAAVFSYPYDFRSWDLLVKDFEVDGGAALRFEGQAIERKQRKDLDELLPQITRMMVIGGHEVPVANLPHHYASDAAGRLAEITEFGATYYDSDKHRVFSLRSRADFDVSLVAKRYGGGGHKNAAGFRVPLGWEGD